MRQWQSPHPRGYHTGDLGGNIGRHRQQPAGLAVIKAEGLAFEAVTHSRCHDIVKLQERRNDPAKTPETEGVEKLLLDAADYGSLLREEITDPTGERCVDRSSGGYVNGAILLAGESIDTHQESAKRHES
jgi:hypothetical protein